MKLYPRLNLLGLSVCSAVCGYSNFWPGVALCVLIAAFGSWKGWFSI